MPQDTWGAMVMASFVVSTAAFVLGLFHIAKSGHQDERITDLERTVDRLCVKAGLPIPVTEINRRTRAGGGPAA